MIFFVNLQITRGQFLALGVKCPTIFFSWNIAGSVHHVDIKKHGNMLIHVPINWGIMKCNIIHSELNIYTLFWGINLTKYFLIFRLLNSSQQNKTTLKHGLYKHFFGCYNRFITELHYFKKGVNIEKFGVTTEASCEFLYVNCRQLSKFLLKYNILQLFFQLKVILCGIDLLISCVTSCYLKQTKTVQISENISKSKISNLTIGGSYITKPQLGTKIIQCFTKKQYKFMNFMMKFKWKINHNNRTMSNEFHLLSKLRLLKVNCHMMCLSYTVIVTSNLTRYNYILDSNKFRCYFLCIQQNKTVQNLFTYFKKMKLLGEYQVTTRICRRSWQALELIGYLSEDFSIGGIKYDQIYYYVIDGKQYVEIFPYFLHIPELPNYILSYPYSPYSVINSRTSGLNDEHESTQCHIATIFDSNPISPHFYQLTSSHATESENQALKYVFFFFLMAKLNLLHHTDSFMARKVYQELKSKQEVINAEEQTNFFICCNPIEKAKTKEDWKADDHRGSYTNQRQRINTRKRRSI
ncbi:hypothetical protein VP01_1212g1 [Puccinia sorghi]|uniref:Uncharacterized protein n=1 Tax=Puccinia sorghi TaxID=27349 RepID=A0A0L6VQA5_9BASI|nr:hypothetical protein VP01_1212g1 [Puccinia sorghi]